MSNIKNWLSPRGVITGGRLGFRLLAMVAFIVLSMLTLGLIAQIATGSLLVVVDSIAAIFLIVGLPLAIWIILATLTKHYRTKGVWAPFLFALITPAMPFMFFFTWIFSSKKRAAANIALATEKTNQANRPNLVKPNHEQSLQTQVKTDQSNTQSVVHRMR